MLQDKAVKDLFKYLEKVMNQKRIDYIFTLNSNSKIIFQEDNRGSQKNQNINAKKILKETENLKKKSKITFTITH